MENRYMTLNELAKYLSISPHTIYKWVESNTIPFIKLGGRLIRFDKEGIDIWIKSQGSASCDISTQSEEVQTALPETNLLIERLEAKEDLTQESGV